MNDPELKNNLKKTGLSHLTAVSGYNLTLISSIVFEFLKIFPLSRLILFFLSTFSILIFSLFVGGQASVIRASLMGVLIIFCKSSGRIPLKRNVLTAAAISISLFQPSTLIFDLGFQLSFLATIGILYLAQPLEKLFRFKVLAETFSAQLLTLPIIWYYFGQINFFSLFINAIVLPIIPSLMILGLIAIFLINLPFIQLISLPYDLLAKVISWLSFLPPTNFQPPLFLIVALYLFAFAFIYKLNKNALPDFSLNFK
ncbi:MAG: ComEC/Rec2 family competence protein [Patescibacteria group bacterium]|nr:ComEC/Rec2 family competence protein [Patescibacteria group bacterium]